MPTRVPTPVAAVLGLLPTVVEGARRLPARAGELPVLAMSTALTGLESARREYTELAERGERLVSSLRGRSPKATPQASPKASSQAPQKATPQATPPSAPAPAPKVVEVPSAKVDSAVTSEVLEVVQEVVAAVNVDAVTNHADLPLADYDHMTLGALRGRLRSLTVEQLVQIRDYEKSKADRLPVVTMLDNRIARLAATGTPTTGTPPTDTPATSAPATSAPATGASASSPRPASRPAPKVAAATMGGTPSGPPRTKVRLT